MFIQKSAKLIPTTKLVAHRGDPLNYPENTVAGVDAAATAGATWAEVDIQYTADFVPLLYHDADLQRISGDPRTLLQTAWPDIRELPANYTSRFGTKFDQTRISTLSDLMAASKDWPNLRLFIELKSEPLEHFGVERIVDDVSEKIADAVSRNQIAAIISKHDGVLEEMRKRGGLPIGWVVPDFNAAQESRATELDLDFMFINQKRLDDWRGGHQKTEQWVIYTVNDLETANAHLAAGADMIETDVFGELAAKD